MAAAPASSTTPEQAGPVLASAEVRAEATVDRWVSYLRSRFELLSETLRFFVFALYVLVGTLLFWLWAIGMVLALLRVVLWGIMLPLLWIADGAPRGPGNQHRSRSAALAQDVEAWWRRREDTYRDIAKPLARYLHEGRAGAIRLWHFTIPRKILVIISAFFLVYVPAMYIVPRPHYVQILDDNVLDYRDGTESTRYLIHAVDMFKPGKTREYLNENMWWLGKINSQGMKARIERGRFYKVWIVGLRWWYTPTLYPNLISITEVDQEGRTLTMPSHLIPPPPQVAVQPVQP